MYDMTLTDETCDIDGIGWQVLTVIYNFVDGVGVTSYFSIFYVFCSRELISVVKNNP